MFDAHYAEVAVTHLLGMGGNHGDTWENYRTVELKTDIGESDDWDVYLLIFEDIRKGHRWAYTWTVCNYNRDVRFDYAIMTVIEAVNMLGGSIEHWMKPRNCSLEPS